ncbi:MAG: radical SAM protein [Candidatus Aminicenantales bacterium]
MGECLHCMRKSPTISSFLGVCADCVRLHYKKVKPRVEEAHRQVKERFGLPARPPRVENGLQCKICTNLCRIPEGGRGYCGVRFNSQGKLCGGRIREGLFHSYFDPLPTNCVADWVCAAGTESGYPQFSYSPGVEHGYKNLAVFFTSCTFNCLFCQNWHYREESLERGNSGPEALAEKVDERTACICYFGGDPTPQLPYALKASSLAIERKKGNILRICWETNGSMNPRLLKKMADISLQSGGCIKFDLKAWNDNLHRALCGISNKRTLHNFKILAWYLKQRPDPPFLVASTLLVPGYVDEQEVKDIAGFIASLDPDIPYSLLAFYPHFYLKDLPFTSREHAQRCLEAARKQGLKRVRIGNIHLL